MNAPSSSSFSLSALARVEWREISHVVSRRDTPVFHIDNKTWISLSFCVCIKFPNFYSQCTSLIIIVIISGGKG